MMIRPRSLKGAKMALRAPMARRASPLRIFFHSFSRWLGVKAEWRIATFPSKRALTIRDS